jgi:Tol biopolymer transport system component
MSARRLVVPAALAVAVAAAGCGGGDRVVTTAPKARASAAAAVPSVPAGRFAFRRFLDDAQTRGAVFTVNTDGTGERQITHPPAGTVDDQPDFSPDGSQIAFERCSDAKGCVAMVVGGAGGKPRQVKMRCRLKGGCDASAPAWLPDGRLLVELAQGREKVDGDARQIQEQSIVVVDAQGGHQRTVVRRDNWRGGQSGLAVSADGKTVVYTRENSWLSKPAFGAALYAVSIKGGRERRISPLKLGGGDHATVSPDGTVLFRSYDGEDSRQSDYWTVRLDGSGLRQLTHFEQGTLVLSGSYSPDGTWIVHASDGVGGNADLYVMKADGTANQPLTRTKAWDSAPDWGPPATG